MIGKGEKKNKGKVFLLFFIFFIFLVFSGVLTQSFWDNNEIDNSNDLTASYYSLPPVPENVQIDYQYWLYNGTSAFTVSKAAGYGVAPPVTIGNSYADIEAAMLYISQDINASGYINVAINFGEISGDYSENSGSTTTLISNGQDKNIYFGDGFGTVEKNIIIEGNLFFATNGQIVIDNPNLTVFFRMGKLVGNSAPQVISVYSEAKAVFLEGQYKSNLNAVLKIFEDSFVYMTDGKIEAAKNCANIDAGTFVATGGELTNNSSNSVVYSNNGNIILDGDSNFPKLYNTVAANEGIINCAGTTTLTATGAKIETYSGKAILAADSSNTSFTDCFVYSENGIAINITGNASSSLSVSGGTILAGGSSSARAIEISSSSATDAVITDCTLRTTNGYVIDAKGSGEIEIENSVLESSVLATGIFTGSGATGSIRVTSSTLTAYTGSIVLWYGGNVIIDDCTVIAENGGGFKGIGGETTILNSSITVSADNAVNIGAGKIAEITNTTIISTAGVFSISVGNAGILTITGGEIYGKYEGGNNAHTIYVAPDAKVSITNGYVESEKARAIHMDGGSELAINGGTYIGATTCIQAEGVNAEEEGTKISITGPTTITGGEKAVVGGGQITMRGSDLGNGQKSIKLIGGAGAALQKGGNPGILDVDNIMIEAQAGVAVDHNGTHSISNTIIRATSGHGINLSRGTTNITNCDVQTDSMRAIHISENASTTIEETKLVSLQNHSAVYSESKNLVTLMNCVISSGLDTDSAVANCSSGIMILKSDNGTGTVYAEAGSAVKNTNALGTLEIEGMSIESEHIGVHCSGTTTILSTTITALGIALYNTGTVDVIDSEIVTTGTNFSIDTSGNTTLSNSKVANSNAGAATVVYVRNGMLKVQTGTIIEGGTSYTVSLVNFSTFEMYGGSIETNATYAVSTTSANNTVTVYDGTISAKSAIYGTGTTVTIESGTITGTVTCGIRNEAGNINIRGGYVSGPTTGIQAGTATVNILGGTVSTTSGTAISGSGIVNISGGTITAATGTALGGSGMLIIEGGTISATTGVAINKVNGTVTISQAAGKETRITSASTNLGTGTIFIGLNGSINVEGGLIENTGTGNALYNKGNLNMSGGIITSISANALINDVGSAEITGGTISTTIGVAINNLSGTVTISQAAGKETKIISENTSTLAGTIVVKGTVVIGGGIIKNTSSGNTIYNTGMLEVTGGAIETETGIAIDNMGTTKISGTATVKCLISGKAINTGSGNGTDGNGLFIEGGFIDGGAGNAIYSVAYVQITGSAVITSSNSAVASATVHITGTQGRCLISDGVIENTGTGNAIYNDSSATKLNDVDVFTITNGTVSANSGIAIVNKITEAQSGLIISNSTVLTESGIAIYNEKLIKIINNSEISSVDGISIQNNAGSAVDKTYGLYITDGSIRTVNGTAIQNTGYVSINGALIIIAATGNGSAIYSTNGLIELKLGTIQSSSEATVNLQNDEGTDAVLLHIMGGAIENISGGVAINKNATSLIVRDILFGGYTGLVYNDDFKTIIITFVGTVSDDTAASMPIAKYKKIENGARGEELSSIKNAGRYVVYANGNEKYIFNGEQEFDIQKRLVEITKAVSNDSHTYSSNLGEWVLTNNEGFAWVWDDSLQVPVVNNTDGYLAIIDMSGFDFENNTFTGASGVTLIMTEGFERATCYVVVNVSKLTVYITQPTSSDTKEFGSALSEWALTNDNFSWVWDNETQVPTIGDRSGYVAKLDMDNSNFDFENCNYVGADEGISIDDLLKIAICHVVVDVKKATLRNVEFELNKNEEVYNASLYVITADDFILITLLPQGFDAIIPTITYSTNNIDFTATPIIKNAGTYYVRLSFETTQNYEAFNTDSVIFTVIKADYNYSAPVVNTPLDNTYGNTLENWTFGNANWRWSNASTVPTVNNSGYSAILTLEIDHNNYKYDGIDNAEYNEETGELLVHSINVVVAKKVAIFPSENIFDMDSKKEGASLKDWTLPEGWKWVNDINKLASGEYQEEAYIEVDDDNYDYSLAEAPYRYDPETGRLYRTIDITVYKDNTFMYCLIGGGIALFILLIILIIAKKNKSKKNQTNLQSN